MKHQPSTLPRRCLELPRTRFTRSALFTALATTLVGFGVGASVELTPMGMVPHNDYLRLFFECGLFVFISFVSLIGHMNRNIGLNFRLIPFFTISLYFISPLRIIYKLFHLYNQ